MIDEEATAALNAAEWVTELNKHILDSVMYGPRRGAATPENETSPSPSP